MKLERTKNALRNTYYGLINAAISIVGPFAVRTVFIHTLGAQYLGLNGLFTSILSVLNLTELGFSSAIVFCMYKPIAQDDAAAISALLLFYKKVYRYVGGIILTVGCLLIPFLPKLIHGTYPADINLTTVYLVYLLNTVLSYFLFAYLGALITAFQRLDVLSRINIFLQTAMYTLQIFLLLKLSNYYAYIAVMPLFTIINNLRTAFLARKMFPQYHPCGQLAQQYKQEIKEKVSGLFIHKVCIVTRNAFDSIFVSMFLGLTATTIFNNYYYIMNAVVMLTSVLSSAIVAGAGNSVALEPPRKNYEDMCRMNFIYMWLAGWLACTLFCLYQPFMKWWMGPSLMYPMGCVILICVYFYLLKMSDVRYIYELAKGLWWENRYRSVAEAVCNLVLNCILGKLFGIYGILVGTLSTLFFVNLIYGNTIIFRHYFIKESPLAYFRTQCTYALIAGGVCMITYYACRWTGDGIPGMGIRLLLCMLLPNVLFWLIYRRTSQFQTAMPWLLGKIPHGNIFRKYLMPTGGENA